MKIRVFKEAQLMYVLLCTLTVFSLNSSLCANENPYYFNRISTEKGLSNHRVYAVLQDSRGFMWFGTTDGLNRYDGTNFKTFYKYDLDVNSSFIISLCEDNQGNIWIGTDNGVSLYNIKKDIFKRLEKTIKTKYKILNKVSVIKKDEQGRIWLSVDKQGLFSYDPETEKLSNYFVEKGVQKTLTGVSSLYFDKNNTFLLSFYFDNLYYADQTFKTIRPFTLTDGSQPFKRDNIIRMIKGTNYNTIYIASVNKGVYEMNLSQRTLKPILLSNEGKIIPNDLFMSEENHLWIATTNGIYKYDIASEEVIHIEMLDEKLSSLSDVEVMSITLDDLKGIWVGTFSSGVLYANNAFVRFKKVYKNSTTSLAGTFVQEFVEDKDKNVWIGTRRNGLFKYNPTNGELHKLKSQGLPDNIFGICREGGNLWIGSYEGIYKMNIQTGRVKMYNRRDEKSKLRDDRIYRIYKNSANKILVGTALGLLEYQATEDNFKIIEKFNGVFVDDILEDSKGNMWYATYANGLFKHDVETNHYINYKNIPDDPTSIPCNKIISLFEDSKKQIWITTFGGGFCRLNADNTFTIYDISNGAPSNIIYKIIEDENKDFWISSQNGLIKFSPDKVEFKIYTINDGILNNEFDILSGIRTSTGDILFGSKDGFIQFNPKNFNVNPKVPTIVLTDFFVNNVLIHPNVKGSPLKKSISETHEIKLSATQNNIEFRFSILNFHSPFNNKLYYKLEGFDDDWRIMPSGHNITFDNLPDGNYVLHIKGVSSDGIWNESYPPLRIIVTPKFYKSAFAIIIYIICTISLLILVIIFLRKRTIMHQKKLQQTYEKNREIQLYNEKIDLFSNIAHEIKTPLTLIRTPLENIMNSPEHFNEEIYEDLNLISYNALHLSQLINELLDFSKIEKKGFKLSFVELDIIEKIKFLKYNFHNIAESKCIDMSLTCSEEHIYIYADEQQIVKIFNNLFSNALKYGEKYITISIQSKENVIVVSVKNDGAIIPLEKRATVFEPFIQIHDTEKKYIDGFGIGLSLARKFAELHAGTLVMDDDLTCNNFILTLPRLSSISEKELVIAAEEEKLEISDEVKPVVLIVEDNVELLTYIEKKLRKHYKVLTATNGKMALETVRKKMIDVIVTDISMPQMDGLQMCSELKKNFETSHIPIIVLSAHSSQQSKISSMEHGVDNYIEKPFSMDLLISYINGHLNKRKDLVNLYKSIVNPSPKESSLSERDKDFLIQLDEIVIKNISDPDFSNDQLAELLYVSKSTLNRKFKGLLNTSPNEYIRNKRLILAAKLLTEGSLRINEVCYKVGFETPSYFIKCFKNYFGKLPTEYIELMKHNDAESINPQTIN